ncbi:uncharacterized protein LOC124658863 [Lolium rigidum]|uniref:uncharacterized protein LOC124658863 n=1 Tax=Lolium rigidum TaxID=89674 RepID=UPI001F5CF65D|nr:uncharacterized protein LOC124658863 [Lolium rigidum]
MGQAYRVRIEDEGAVSVVAEAHDTRGDDEADSVAAHRQIHVQGPQPEESAGEVGEETRAAASMHSGGAMNGKRKLVGGVGPSESEQSTLKVNPEAPGWIKRVRVGGHATERSPCPNRVGTLEKMIRSYPERRGDYVLEPSLGMTFDSLGEAYDFYNLYSWEHGFGVRYGKSRLNPERTKTMQEIVCG